MLSRKLRLARLQTCDYWLIKHFNIQVKKKNKKFLIEINIELF